MNKTIYLAGGCFWGVQKYFDQYEGILETEVGYANGRTENPSYEEVCNGSGQAETLKIIYDPEAIILEKILGYYFLIIDPTLVNRQGNDFGIQYRTGIYYVDDEDLPEIERSLEPIREKYVEPIVVEVKKLESFYSAEEYHQKYLDKNPGGYCHIPREMLMR